MLARRRRSPLDMLSRTAPDSLPKEDVGQIRLLPMLNLCGCLWSFVDGSAARLEAIFEGDRVQRTPQQPNHPKSCIRPLWRPSRTATFVLDGGGSMTAECQQAVPLS